MTPRARSALDLADIVIGYSGYLDSLDGIVPTHRMQAYALGQERDRASEAIRLAQAGRSVALVSSGDVGVYGMAGLVFELMAEEATDSHQPAPFVEVVPGVTAATAAAALLGAPLMLDFAAISLSDLLVPWDTVERRLRAAAEGDLTIVLYNPASQRRRAGLARAHEIILQHRPATTPVGIVREAYRQDQVVGLSTLGELPLDQVDMRTVLVIGCSRTEVLAGRLVTRRGYQDAVGDPTVRAESTHARP
jgi:precorrin-3B C17-methyltransferase